MEQSLEVFSFSLKEVVLSFYVYLHKKATTGEVFYVGKGTNWRAWNRMQRNKFWKRVVEKHGRIVEIVEKDIQEWYAHELEIDLIAYYGRRDQGLGTLVNLTDGGEGSSGYKHTDAVLGHNHPNFDKTIWKFKNVFTQDVCHTTQYDFQNKYPELNVRSMVYRKTSTFGWIIEGYTPQIIINKLLQGNIGENNANTDRNVYSLFNLETGETFTGSRFQFHEKYGFRIDFLLCNNPHKTFRNWCLADTISDAHFSPKADYKRYTFVHESGDTFVGTRRDMEKAHSISVHDLVRADLKKRAKRVKGWTLDENKDTAFVQRRDEVVYKFIHKSGEMFEGTRKALEKKFEINIQPLFGKSCTKTQRGWSLVKEESISQ